MLHIKNEKSLIQNIQIENNSNTNLLASMWSKKYVINGSFMLCDWWFIEYKACMEVEK